MSLFGPPNIERMVARKDVKGLIKALRYRNNSTIRHGAAEALGILGDACAVEPLIEALDDTDTWVRNHAAASLGKLGAGRAIEALLKALVDDAWQVRRASAESLGRSGDLRAVEPLIQAIGDKEPGVRKAVANALGQIGDSRAVEPLIKALGLEQSDRLLEAAVRDGSALAKMQADNRSDRIAAATALGQLNDPRAIESLIPLLGLGSGIREAAAAALGGLSESRWKEWIRGDEGDFARLGASGDPRAVQPLVKALRDNSYVVERRHAVTALGELSDPRAVETLIEALDDEDVEVRTAAANAIGRIGDSKAIEALIRVFNEEDFHFPIGKEIGERELKYPRAIIDGLRKSDDTRAVDALIKALSHPWAEFRRAAAAALETRCDPRAAETLIQALEDENKTVRRAAAKVLISFASRQPKVIYKQWEKIAELVQRRHMDQKGYSSTCSYYEHEDRPHRDVGIGLGLAFPDKPDNLDF